MIIDYHSHLKWDRKNNTYNSSDLIEDMISSGIDFRVVSALYGNSIREQNDVVADLVRNNHKLIGCAVINPKLTDCIQEMERIIELGCFKAIELDSMEHCYYPDECDALDDIFKLASENSLLVNVYTGWGCRTMPAQWALYAERYPKVQMVLLHMGTTDFGYGCINLVPKLENLYIETSCMYELPILRKAFNNICHDRFIFGSHYPHKFTRCSIDTFELLNLSKDTQSKLFYENAKRLLKI